MNKTPTKPYMKPSYIISGLLITMSIIALPMLWGSYETTTSEISIESEQLEAKKIQLLTLQREFDSYKKDQSYAQQVALLAPGQGELDQENILRELEEMSIEHNIGLTSLTFREEAASPHPTLGNTELNLQLSGTNLESIYGFLSSVEGNPRYYNLAQLQLFENTQGAGGTVRLNLYHKL